MPKDPAFLFYSSDFLSGVTDLTMEERGQYISLLCLQHQKGHLNEKTIRLSVGSVSVDVMKKFSQDSEGNFFNERLDEEIQNRINFTESRRLNGSKGGRPKASAKPNGKPSANLPENENINTVFNKGIAKILNKPYEVGEQRGINGTGQDIDSLVKQLKTRGLDEPGIEAQIKAMKAVYANEKWSFPTNYITLLTSLIENDWITRLDELDPDKQEKIKQNGKQHRPTIDYIGSSQPGSLG